MVLDGIISRRMHERRRAAEEAHGKAIEEARSVAANAVPPCPISVEPACRQKQQDSFEQAHDIAPGCGYYRRRHQNFIERYPDKTPPTYYLEYGEKYCNRFTQETYEKLSPAGKEWFDGVKCGLQKGIEKIINDPEQRHVELIDKDFSTAAFTMHAPVYLKNGLADIPFGDQWTIGITPLEEFLPWKENWRHTVDQVGEVTPDVFKGWKERLVKSMFGGNNEQ